MAKISTLRDDFSGGSIANPPWDDWGGANTVLAGGHITFTSDAAGDPEYYGMSSVANYDLTDSQVTVEVISLPTINIDDSTFSAIPLSMEINPNNRVYWDKDGYGLHPYIVIGGDYVPLAEIAYNSAVHKFLRIREQGGLIYFAYSTDGITWVEDWVTTYTGLTITSLSLDMSVGSYEAVDHGPYSMVLGAINMIPTDNGNFDWKGFEWERRTDFGAPHYTGNWLAKNVIGPNAQDHVTLRLTNPAGNDPFAAEFLGASGSVWGYGTYIVTTRTVASMIAMHKSIVSGGLFTYGSNTPHHNEIDVNEVSSWGVTADDAQLGHNVWFDDSGSNGIQADLQTVDANLVQTHRLVWTPGSVVIDSFVGTDTTGTPYFSSTFESPTFEIPVPDDEVPHFNLWVFDGGDADETTAGATPFEVEYLNFYFSPYAGDITGIKVWNGSTWEIKPIKVWDGTSWEEKPVKRWNGTTWVDAS